jgi:hypothetical protein
MEHILRVAWLETWIFISGILLCAGRMVWSFSVLLFQISFSKIHWWWYPGAWLELGNLSLVLSFWYDSYKEGYNGLLLNETFTVISESEYCTLQWSSRVKAILSMCIIMVLLLRQKVRLSCWVILILEYGRNQIASPVFVPSYDLVFNCPCCSEWSYS